MLLVAAGFGVGIGYGGLKVALGLPAFLMALAVFARPAVGLYAVVFTVPFEAAVMIPGGATLSKALAALVVVAWVFRKLLRRESWRDVLHSPVFVASVAFIAFAMLSRLWSTYTVGVNAQLARLILMFGLTLLVMDLVRTWNQAIWLVRLLVLGGQIAVAFTLWQSYGLGVRRAGEAVSGGVNSTALLLICVLPFAFALVRSPRERLVWRALGLFYIPTAALAVIQTFSRMSLLMGGLLLIAEYIITLRSRRGRIPLLVLTGVAALVFVSLVPTEKLQERAATIVPYIRATFEGGGAGSTTQISGRGFHLKMAYAVFKDHPILGDGYWNFGQYSLQYQFSVPGYSDILMTPRSTHSSFFRVLADLGLVGMALWLAILGVTARELWRAWRATADDQIGQPHMLIRALTFTFLLQQAYGLYAEMQVQKIFWITLGLAVALRALAETESATAGVAREAPATNEDKASLAVSAHAVDRLGSTMGSA
jgi:O-antigen ligase